MTRTAEPAIAQWLNAVNSGLNTPRGAMMATMPPAPRMLKMFAPMMLPMATSDCLRTAAEMVAPSSGRDEPTARMVRPTMVSLACSSWPSEMPPSTSSREPSGMPTRPIRMSMIIRHIGVYIISSSSLVSSDLSSRSIDQARMA